MTIRFAHKNEYPAISAHYRSCHYNARLGDEDQVVLAVDDEIVGAVRITTEHGVKILRGMQIATDWQREGIGSAMLKFVAEQVDLSGCYCLPYHHLTAFYGSIGFEKMEAADAPAFLAERLKDYNDRGLGTIIMRKTT